MSIIRTVGWLLVGKWAFYATTLISFSVILRIISVESYGYYVLASTYLIFADVFYVEAVENAILRHKKNVKEIAYTGLLVSLVFTFIVTTIVLLSAKPISAIYEIEQLEKLIYGVGLVIFFQGLSCVPRSLVLKNGNVRAYSLVGGVSNIVGACAGVVSACSGLEEWSLVVQQGVLQITLLACGVYITREFWSLNYCKETGVQLFKFIKTSFYSSILNVLGNRLDILALGFFVTPAEVGLYGFAKRIIQILQDLVGSSFDKALVVLRNVSDVNSNDNYKKSVFAQGVLVIPAFVGTAVVIDLIVPLVFGVQWSGSTYLIVAMAVGGVFRAMVTIERAELIILGKVNTILRLRFVDLVVGIAAVMPTAHYGVYVQAVIFSVRYLLSYLLLVLVRCGGFSAGVKQMAFISRLLVLPIVGAFLMYIVGMSAQYYSSDFVHMTNLLLLSGTVLVCILTYIAFLFFTRKVALKILGSAR